VSVDRPTFHESWYRIANLRPRLLSGVKTRRQYFRGQLWYILENPANNQFARMGESAYRFIGALDSRKTVAEVWELCNEQLGDSAPTQGEVIQLLGQLHAMNVLYVDLPPDAEGLLNRYSRRVRREILSYLTMGVFSVGWASFFGPSCWESGSISSSATSASWSPRAPMSWHRAT